MIVVHAILLVVFTIYFGWMLVLIWGWSINQKKTKSSSLENLAMSVLIPFRNESEHLHQLLSSLTALKYDKAKVEFIFINDHSDDNSVELLKQGLKHFPFPYNMISLDESSFGKKRAIEAGVSVASYPLLVTTDADCLHSENWLQEINNLAVTGCDFIIAPVINKKQSGLLSNIQQIESLLLAGITVGSAKLKIPLLCSGANLTYTKSLFKNLDPYKNNYEVLSGDDMFFLEKVVKENSLINIGVSFDSEVQTEGSKSLSDMFSRSIRWAAKSNQIKIPLSIIFGAIVLITNFSILFMIALVILGDDSIVFFIKLCAIKTAIDVLFLVLLANRYRRYETIMYFPIMVVFYPFYLLTISVGVVLSSPSWKGR